MIVGLLTDTFTRASLYPHVGKFLLVFVNNRRDVLPEWGNTWYPGTLVRIGRRGIVLKYQNKKPTYVMYEHIIPYTSASGEYPRAVYPYHRDKDFRNWVLERVTKGVYVWDG